MSKLFGAVDWIELHEALNNQTVYISLSTGVTSEKRPLNVDIKNAYDFEWWELLDSKSKRFYYFNTITKQTTWIKPQSNSIIQFGNVQIPVDELTEKIESQCRINDGSLLEESLLDSPGGLSSTPSTKLRPFPRTNPRSVPRRVGGAESPITQPQTMTKKSAVRRRPDYNDVESSDPPQLGASVPQSNVSESSSNPLSYIGEKLLSSQQRCQSKNSLTSSGTEANMNTMGMIPAQSHIFRQGRNNTSEFQGLTTSINQETLMNMNNGGGIHQGMGFRNTMNGCAVYDYPPGTNNTHYMTHQNYMLMQQQGMNSLISSSSGISQPEAFSLRRPQSEQAIGGDINKQRMTMVSPRSDIIPGIAQSNRYYPTTGSWVERSLSPPPFMPSFPQYAGPLPGWNSELFRKDQAPAKLLNWCKDSIQKPLLMSTDKILKSEACQSFKQIQGYMGDRKSKHSPTELVNSIIQKGANYYPLRDEIFMQICKQTTNSPDELSTLRGWELLMTCLNYFAPSVMFRPYLEGYVLRHLDNNLNNECPTPPKVQQAAEQTIQILSRQSNSTLRFDPNFQYHYLQQQQQQMMMMSSNMQTIPNQKNHLQLQLFESTDNSDDSASQRIMPLNSHFGNTLDEIMRAQYLKFPERELPWIVVVLCEEILRRSGERAEGIFRVEAGASQVQAMCTVLDLYESVGEHPLTSSDLSPHTPACSLKRWLDSLLEPLVPPSLCSVSQAGRARTPLDVYRCLSPLHQATLMYLVSFLQLLSLDDNVRFNRMGPFNLAVVLAPHIFQLEPASNEYVGSRGSKRADGGSGVDTCRSDHSANDSSGSSSRGGPASAEESFRSQVNFIYQLIVGLDT